MPTFIDELPARARVTSDRSSKYDNLVEDLKAAKDQWADVTEDLVALGVTEKGLESAAGNISRAGFAAFKPAGSFESAHRLDPETGARRVFAKYVGEPTEAPAEEPAEA